MNIYAAMDFLEAQGLLLEFCILPDKVEIVVMLEGVRRMIYMTYEQVFLWVNHAQKKRLAA
jgi:hypothetical protein